MSAKPEPLDEATKLERQLNRLIAAEKRQLKNEDILVLEKNGDIGYERIRTTATTTRTANEELLSDATSSFNRRAHAASENFQPDASPDPCKIPANPHSLPDKLPQPPMNQEIGDKMDTLSSPPTSQPAPATSAEDDPPQSLTATMPVGDNAPPSPAEPPISCHHPVGQAALPVPLPSSGVGRSETGSVEQAALPVPPPASPDLPPAEKRDPANLDPLTNLLTRTIAAASVRRGRPPAFDDHGKGQLVALLSVGLSMRQAAAVLGVSHTTVQKTLKADPSLGEEITAARFQAQLQPLACVIREARRSWKAATWLLKYLDSKIATHEETPDERRARQQQEAEEFFARSTPGVKKRAR